MKLVKLCSRNNKLFHFALILPPAPALFLSLEKIIIFCHDTKDPIVFTASKQHMKHTHTTTTKLIKK